MNVPPHDLITLAAAAALLPPSRGKRSHVSSFRRWIKTGRIPGWKLNGRSMVSRAVVLAMMAPVPIKPRKPKPAGAAYRKQVERTARRLGIWSEAS